MNCSLMFGRIFCIIFLFAGIQSFASTNGDDKQKDAEYLRVVTKRADKIVANLGISDSADYYKIREIIAYQYRDLNSIHEARNAEVKQVKAEAGEDAKEKIQSLEATAKNKLKKLHKKYLNKLSRHLSAEQIEKVKDGMTYGVLPITYKGYQDMLPNLTAEQKKQILQYLTEARELAMDAESSEKKHATFGRFKGKINNYLSAAGINMKQASDEWAKRLKAQGISL